LLQIRFNRTYSCTTTFGNARFPLGFSNLFDRPRGYSNAAKTSGISLFLGESGANAGDSFGSLRVVSGRNVPTCRPTLSQGKVLIGGLQIVLARDGFGVAEPIANDVRGKAVHQLGLPRCSEIVEQPLPSAKGPRQPCEGFARIASSDWRCGRGIARRQIETLHRQPLPLVLRREWPAIQETTERHATLCRVALSLG